MRARSEQWWCEIGLLGLCVGLLTLPCPSAADEPQPKLLEQRSLQVDEARHAEKLLRQIDQAEEAGRFREALSAAKELLTLRERVQGADHWETTNARWLSKLLQRRAEFSAPQEAEYRRSLANGGAAADLSARGRYAQAQPLLEQVLETTRQLLGEEHYATANAYIKLALNLHALGRYAEAEPSLQKALALYRRLLGEEHPATADGYNNLALNQQAQGRYPEADEGFRKALSLYRRLLGEQHPYTTTASNNLAANLLYQGKYAEAEDGFRKVLAARLALLGEEHPDTATSYDNLAAALGAQGKYAETNEACRKALMLRLQLLGEEHPLTAQSYNNLAGNLSRQGHVAEAEQGFRKALALNRKLLGENHPRTASTYMNLAHVLNGQGKYAEAEEMSRKALDLDRQVLGEDHPSTARSYHNLAGNLYAQGKYAEAEETFRKALDLHRRLFGEEHSSTATSYGDLASAQDAQGKYAEAAQGHRQALARYQRLLGEEHPFVATSSLNLAYSLLCLGQFREAEEQLRHAADAFSHARPRSATTGLERASATGAHSPLPLLAAVIARDGRSEEAWQRFEEGRGRGTWEDLQARLARDPTDRSRLAELSRRLERIDQLLARYGSVRQATEEETRQHQEQLAQRRQIQDQLDTLTRDLALQHGLAEPQAAPLAKVQAALPADTALLAWVDVQFTDRSRDVLNERWAVLLRAKGKPVWVRQKGSGKESAWTDADGRLPAELAAVLRERPRANQGDWKPLAERLYRQHLEPLEAHLAAAGDLPAVRHLVVLPSAVMDGIPVDVLTDRYTFSRAPSATVFAFLRAKPQPQTHGLLALADPVFDRPDAGAKPVAVPPGGLLLLAVVPGSNASKAGLRAGDVLLRYQETSLKTSADLRPSAPDADAKLRIPVEVWRAGETLTVEMLPGPLGVSLAKEPAPEALARRRRIEAELVASRGDGDWKALPGTRVEVAALAQRFRDAHQPLTVLTDSDASEQRLTTLASDGRLGKFRYLHLATHGAVNWDFPLQSALILSRDQLPDPDKQLNMGLPVFDGRLTAAEVLRDWNLDADLVTLSACETGLGQYAHGEGFMGFAQALLICGTRSVCLSLWQVDDAATALLMDRFYANLLGQRDGLTKPLAKAEALAEAKVWLRTLPRAEAVRRATALTGGVERGKGRPALPGSPAVPETTGDAPPYAHPFYWAAFVLVGDQD
jgi:tetratricopeptide (TPR) repeat protein